MATQAHCLYCFETLSSSLERRKQLTLGDVEELWDMYQTACKASSSTAADADTFEEERADGSTDGGQAHPSTLSVPSTGANSLNTSSPSSASSSSMSVSSSLQPKSSNASSRTSVTSNSGSQDPPLRSPESSPLFITWETTAGRNGSKSLRGCIGTFEAQELEHGLQAYALTSAFEDTRFMPIAASELPNLEVAVTLLTDFEPAPEPMAWELGKHGIRISFYHHNRKYGATYLPDVAKEQGWTKTETMVSLMRKAGWNGRRDDWQSVKDLKVIRYQGKKVTLAYEAWRHWREWARAEGLLQ